MTPSLHLNMYICMFGIFVGFFFLFFLVVVAERGDGNSLPHGMDEAVIEVPRNKLLRVVLVSPQIPGIPGCIDRTRAASAVALCLLGIRGCESSRLLGRVTRLLQATGR
ncbi:uncharacterized protein LOC110643682 isoform X5 [Hevea brasiliensis]|uniref:uncharacterized protein LOC110643682 isoform X5 n=1 Tax=Hevea brasiliensis TaxID=3981 RepID=UPI0025DBCCA0|nr:uncharacterized protein LOC110643682 isoform X5 [Hevea brasiliensis]